jgi:phage terminase small subunit
VFRINLRSARVEKRKRVMGRRGPKSAADLATLRVVRQTPRVASNVPPAPAHLSPATKAWWRVVLADFSLEQYQLNVLLCACEAWDRHEQARAALSKFGLTYEDSKGMIRSRPEVAIERDSRVAFLRAVRELNLQLPEPDRYDAYGNPIR